MYLDLIGLGKEICLKFLNCEEVKCHKNAIGEINLIWRVKNGWP